jgi:hypothetical protein
MRPQNDDIEKDSLNLKKQNGRIGYAAKYTQIAEYLAQ